MVRAVTLRPRGEGFEPDLSGLATRIYGGLELLYLPGDRKVGDACEVAQPHMPLMTNPRRQSKASVDAPGRVAEHLERAVPGAWFRARI